jgi:FtsP/CotA-like multicopper oxidase with cupredoxin domain
MRRGDKIEMTVENALDTVTTVHWHGLLVPGDCDGGPQQLIHPNDRWRPVLNIDQPLRRFGSILIPITILLDRSIWG